MKFTFYSNMQKVDDMATFTKRLGDNFLCKLTGINLHFDHNRKKYVADGVYTPFITVQKWPNQVSLDFMFWGLFRGFSVVGQLVWPYLTLSRHVDYTMEVEE